MRHLRAETPPFRLASSIIGISERIMLLPINIDGVDDFALIDTGNNLYFESLQKIDVVDEAKVKSRHNYTPRVDFPIRDT